MSSNQGKGGSVLYGISINNKGKLVWTESYQLLQTFVEEVLSLSNGVWSCPGGDAKQYKAEDIDIRWYPETQSITLTGKAKDEIKEKLLSVAAIQIQLASTVNEDFDQNGHVDETITHSSQKDNSTLSLETLSSQLEAISKDVNANATAIKLFTEHANSHNTEMDNLKMENHKLLNENIDLKSENNDLNERVNNLSYTLADLQGKAKIAEDEKDSLITAMRLLIEDSNHNDLNHKESVINANHNEEMVQRCPQTANRLQQTNEVPNEVINPSINLSNGFSALSVDENDVSDRNARDAVRNEVECTYANTHRSTQTPNRKQNQSQRKNSTQHRDNQTKQRTDHRNRPNVVIDFVDVRTLVTVYKTLIQPHFDYCSQVWGCLGITLKNQWQRLQNRAARIITKRGYEFRSVDILKELDLPNLSLRRNNQLCTTMYQVNNNMVPDYLIDLFTKTSTLHNYQTR